MSKRMAKITGQPNGAEQVRRMSVSGGVDL